MGLRIQRLLDVKPPCYDWPQPFGWGHFFALTTDHERKFFLWGHAKLALYFSNGRRSSHSKSEMQAGTFSDQTKPARSPTRPPIASILWVVGWGSEPGRFHVSGKCASRPSGYSEPGTTRSEDPAWYVTGDSLSHSALRRSPSFWQQWGSETAEARRGT